MKIRITFFSGLMTFIVGGILSMIIVVIFSFNQPVKLVIMNYYNEDLNYQNHIDKIQRTKKLISQPVIKYIHNSGLEIKFPKGLGFRDISGKIVLYRPSDDKLDKTINLQLDETGTQQVTSSNFAQGLWIVKMSWNMNGSEYYNEKSLSI